MTEYSASNIPPEKPEQSTQPNSIPWQADQARQYLEAVYGENVWYKAPETFGNLVERWMYAVACGSQTLGAETMDFIKLLASEKMQRRG